MINLLLPDLPQNPPSEAQMFVVADAGIRLCPHGCLQPCPASWLGGPPPAKWMRLLHDAGASHAMWESNGLQQKPQSTLFVFGRRF